MTDTQTSPQLAEAQPNGARPPWPRPDGTVDDAIVIRRRTVDTLLIVAGIVVAAVLVVAGALLTWGSNFAEDYVSDELTAQNIFFPDQAALEEDGRADLVKYAGEQVTTGAEAEAYASFIDGHLADIADGATYADLGGPEREANAAVTEAQESGADEATIADAAGHRRRDQRPAAEPVPGRDPSRAAALHLRLVDDRPDRRHRRHRGVRRRRRDGRARRARSDPPPPHRDRLSDHLTTTSQPAARIHRAGFSIAERPAPDPRPVSPPGRPGTRTAYR